MADVVRGVREWLLSQGSITALIGQRLYLDKRKQGSALPSASITKISETHAHTISDRTGFNKTRLQIECFAQQRVDANALAKAIYQSGIVALKGQTGGTYDVNIRGVMVEDGERNYEIDDTEGGDEGTRVTQFDLMVSHLES